MPSTLPFVLPPIRGREEYGQFLDMMTRISGARGHKVKSRTELMLLAIERLAHDWGLKPPERATAPGKHGNQPRKKIEEKPKQRG